MTSKLVVKTYEPARMRLVVAVTLLALAAGVWGLFDWGRKAGGYDRTAAARASGKLNDQIASLETENEKLRRELALLRTSDRIDREAYQLVSADLHDLQSQIAELNEELAFYRGIMSPADGRSGLGIQAVQIYPGAERDQYRLRLVLVQARRQDARVNGAVTVRLVGARNSGNPESEDLTQFTGEDDKLRYAFRYFQILERDLNLPAGFSPQGVEVILRPDRKGDTVTGSFPWQVTMN